MFQPKLHFSLSATVLGSLSDQNVYQASGCCYLYPNGTYRTSLIHTFNGKDFLSFDMDRKTFVAAVHQAVYYKHLRDGDEVDLQVLTNVYKTVCLDRINVFKNAPKVRLRKGKIILMAVLSSGSPHCSSRKKN